MDRLVIELPEDLKKRLKTYCAKNGKTMRDEVLSMICQSLESYEESVTSEQTEGSPVQAAAAAPPEQVAQSKTTVEFDVRVFRNALNLKEEKKEETISFTIDPLDIGL